MSYKTSAIAAASTVFLLSACGNNDEPPVNQPTQAQLDAATAAIEQRRIAQVLADQKRSIYTITHVDIEIKDSEGTLVDDPSTTPAICGEKGAKGHNMLVTFNGLEEYTNPTVTAPDDKKITMTLQGNFAYDGRSNKKIYTDFVAAQINDEDPEAPHKRTIQHNPEINLPADMDPEIPMALNEGLNSFRHYIADVCPKSVDRSKEQFFLTFATAEPLSAAPPKTKGECSPEDLNQRGFTYRIDGFAKHQTVDHGNFTPIEGTIRFGEMDGMSLINLDTDILFDAVLAEHKVIDLTNDSYNGLKDASQDLYNGIDFAVADVTTACPNVTRKRTGDIIDPFQSNQL